MGNWKSLLQKACNWILARVPVFAKLMVFLVIVGLCFVVIMEARNPFLAFFKAQPVIAPLAFILLSILVGGLFASGIRLRDAWREGRDVAVTSLITIFMLIVGAVLITGASSYADETSKGVAFRTATAWGLAYFALGFF